eukprot:CCRYP_017753-RA/>CCRYP_017753-RA protein AED:0.02 eAED:0.02 QI:263/1/1/1/0.66/0.5/4/2690/869
MLNNIIPSTAFAMHGLSFAPVKVIPFPAMSSPVKPPLLPPSEQTRTKQPHNNDVLCGRGGTINAHPGNEQYRTFVERKKRVYLTARFKREKRLIAQSIVDEIRRLDPPGRFLMKESNGDYWYDVGDEKARDKTSQALRENSMSVRRQMEEEFNETRRQQAREVAIAAGRDPEKAVEEMSGKTKSLETAAPCGLQPRITGLQPAEASQSGFIGRSGYGPLYEAQQPNPPSVAGPLNQQAHMQQGGMHHLSQYEYGHAAHHHPISYEQHATHPPAQYPPQPSYYTQAQAAHPYPYSQPQPHQHYGYAPPIPSHQVMPPPTYDPSMHPSSHYSHHGMPSSRSVSPHVDSQMRHVGHLQPSTHPMPSMMIDSHHPAAPRHHEHGNNPHHLQNHAPPQQADPASALRRHSSNESTSNRHVQFESTENPRSTSKDAGGAPQFPPLVSTDADIPLMIGAKKRSPKRHPQPRNHPYHPNDQMGSLSPEQHDASFSPLHPEQPSQDDTGTVNSPRTAHSTFSNANMSQATPLTFMSNPFSVNTSDSLAKYLEGMEDEISGDVGQEVELVAHAPMLHTHDRAREYETIVPRPQQRHHYGSSASGRSTGDSKASGSYRGTPPRHHKSSRRRRKHRSGHIPSNSGKVQVDFSAAAVEGESSPPPPVKEGPCGNVAVSCGGMLPVPSPIVGRRQHHESFASPVYPLSPNSLDIDKMSLCGTENISHGGGSLIGGASLMNVFEENDSLMANALMDMSVSLGSGPSSGSSLAPQKALGLQPMSQGQAHPHENYGDHESLMGASALMDLSVGSASQSRSSVSGNGSKQNSSSGSAVHSSSGSSTKKNRRSLSPASIDKNRGSGKSDRCASPEQGYGWTWEGKCKE